MKTAIKLRDETSTIVFICFSAENDDRGAEASKEHTGVFGQNGALFQESVLSVRTCQKQKVCCITLHRTQMLVCCLQATLVTVGAAAGMQIHMAQFRAKHTGKRGTLCSECVSVTAI